MFGRRSVSGGPHFRRPRKALRRLAGPAALAGLLLLLIASSAQAFVPGARLWVKTYGNSDTNQAAWAGVAPAPGGGAYATGYNEVPAGNRLLLMKYAADGQAIWLRTWLGSVFDHSQGEAIAVDHSGNVYVAASAALTGGGTATNYANFVLLKYSPAGNLLWVERYPGAADDNSIVGIAVNASNDVYVYGQDIAQATPTVVGGTIVLKYDSAGHRLWATRVWPDLTDPNATGMQAAGLALDSAGDAYVCGTKFTGNGVDYAMFTARLAAADGHQQWLRVYHPKTGHWAFVYGGSSWQDNFNTISVRGPRVSVAGTVQLAQSSPTGWGWVVLNYSLAGKPGHVLTITDPNHLYARSLGVALDASLNAYVVGLTTELVGQTSLPGFTTLKLAPAGHLLWLHRTSLGWAEQVTVDATGSVYVSGQYSDSFDARPAAGSLGVSDSIARKTEVVKYSPQGYQRWLHTWITGTGSSSTGIALGALNDLYTSGEASIATGPSSGYNCALLLRYHR